MSAYSIRCTNCGKRLVEATRICPACGAEQPLHVSRIRCGYCRRRVPSNVLLCPYCKHNPRRIYLRARSLLSLLGVVVIAAFIYGAFNALQLFGGLALLKVSTPTVVVAAEPTLLVVTATLAPSATSTPAPTASPTPFIPTATPTLAPTATPTPTKHVTRVQPTQTLIPSVTPLAPPLPLSPKNGEKIYGPKRRIAFTFQPVELGVNEWYRLQIDFRDRNNQAASWCGWSKGTTILFPSDYYDDSWQLDRTFRWHVNVAASDADPPSTCEATVSRMSAPSEERLFYWY